MNKDQIIQMAREAGLVFNEQYGTDIAVKMYRERVERFAVALIEATKEEDAKICDEFASEYPAYEFSEAIRASK